MSEARSVPSEEQVLSWFDELSNWGRWGDDDRSGTLNHVTPERRAAAAGLVHEGIAVSCSWDIKTGPHDHGDDPPQRFMLGTGLGLRDEGRRSIFPGGRAHAAADFIGMNYHGISITHVDALSHLFWDGKMYNGVPASAVTDFLGATEHDVLTMSSGLVTRGVLLDIARLRGVDVLADDDPVHPEDLEAAEEAAGVRVGVGDVLLMRTGESGVRRAAGRRYRPSERRSGFQAACLPWLHEREVAAIGSDVPQDPLPSGYESVSWPIHMVGIVAMGLWLIDNCQLEDLAETCARLGRWEFQFVLAPLRFQGATGSPANPLAVF